MSLALQRHDHAGQAVADGAPSVVPARVSVSTQPLPAAMAQKQVQAGASVAVWTDWRAARQLVVAARQAAVTVECVLVQHRALGAAVAAV